MYVIVVEEAVYHYGTLSDGLHRLETSWHYEGDTLSVSLCPEEWWSKSPHEAAGVELWKLAHLDGTSAKFIDLARLSSHNKRDIETYSRENGFGTLEAPDFVALGRSYGRQVPKDMRELPLLLAWAKTKDVDGIWFSEQIAADMPTSSRGGIFQCRLSRFGLTSLGVHGSTVWPVAMLPNLALELL